jgi:hypothetical protein
LPAVSLPPLKSALFRFGHEKSVAAGRDLCCEVCPLYRWKTMPVLFGYLVALMLLLGGGYAGLQWLASPDAISTHQHIGEKPIAGNLPKKTELKSAGGATLVPGEVDGGSKIEATTGAATAVEAPHQSDHAGNQTAANAKPSDPAPGVNNDSSSEGGCMPFGVTARGAVVFPIQCQASIERQHGAAPSSPPPPPAAASGDNQAVELVKPGDNSTANTKPTRLEPSNNDSANAGRKDVATTGGTSNQNSLPESRPAKPAVSGEGGLDAAHKDVAKHENAAEHKDAVRHRDAAEHKDDAQPRDIASTQKQSESRSEPGVNPRKQDKRNARSPRPRLVMMYLRTIEFPDGHREQQLLPIRRSRGIAVEAEDQ